MRSSDRREGYGWCRRFFKWVGEREREIWAEREREREEWVDCLLMGMGGLLVIIHDSIYW